MRKIVKVREEIMSRTLKDFFLIHFYSEIKRDLIPTIISAFRENLKKRKKL
jgi:hypothetical protein